MSYTTPVLNDDVESELTLLKPILIFQERKRNRLQKAFDGFPWTACKPGGHGPRYVNLRLFRSSGRHYAGFQNAFDVHQQRVAKSRNSKPVT